MAKACGNSDCGVSSGIHEGPTFGSGDLDFNGFWQFPCWKCARDYERRHPGCEPCWPFSDAVLDEMERRRKEMK